MGNSLSQVVVSERRELLSKLYNIDVPILDIGNCMGSTGYIDFITPNLLNGLNIMKGKSYDGREFIVFKAKFKFTDDIEIQTFTTFFKRYVDNDITWHTCGHHGLNLFNTSGGADNNQIQLLYELLRIGKIDLTNLNKEEIDNLKLLWRFGIETDYENRKDIYPVEIILGN